MSNNELHTAYSTLRIITRTDHDNQSAVALYELGTIDIHPFRFRVTSIHRLRIYEDGSELYELTMKQES